MIDQTANYSVHYGLFNFFYIIHNDSFTHKGNFHLNNNKRYSHKNKEYRLILLLFRAWILVYFFVFSNIHVTQKRSYKYEEIKKKKKCNHNLPSFLFQFSTLFFFFKLWSFINCNIFASTYSIHNSRLKEATA